MTFRIKFGSVSINKPDPIMLLDPKLALRLNSLELHVLVPIVDELFCFGINYINLLGNFIEKSLPFLFFLTRYLFPFLFHKKKYIYIL